MSDEKIQNTNSNGKGESENSLEEVNQLFDKAKEQINKALSTDEPKKAQDPARGEQSKPSTEIVEPSDNRILDNNEIILERGDLKIIEGEDCPIGHKEVEKEKIIEMLEKEELSACVEKEEDELTLEEIEAMEETAAGPGAGDDGGFSIPAAVIWTNFSQPFSVPVPIGISYKFDSKEEWIPPIRREIEIPDRIPFARDDTIDARGEQLIVYENSLADGSTPGAHALVLFGNILSNDDLGDPPVTLLDLSLPGFTTDKSNPNVWTIDNGFGIFTLYVVSDGERQQGDFTFELYDNTDHPPIQGPNTLILEFSYSFQDVDGDTAGAKVIITDVDDVPNIEESDKQPPDLIVDETNFADDAVSSFAGLFTIVPGADGLESLTYSLSILAQGADSGLVDTLSNDAVFLFLEGTDVVGRAGSNLGAEVFRVSVNSATGAVTLNQSRAVVHDDPTDHDEALSPETLSAANLVSLTVTVVDGDGDIDSEALNIGTALLFEDDGPDIDRNHVEVPCLVVDESDLDIDASASFAHLFTSTFGNDGPKDTDDNDIADPDAIIYTLGISANGANSGLIDTLTNDEVLLFLEGGIVIGRTETDNLEVFRITVDSLGVVTLNQSRAIVHDDPNDPDEANSPEKLAKASLVTLTATITDGDGDQDSATAKIGHSFKFEDDGPGIDPDPNHLPELRVDETFFNIDASLSFAQAFDGVFGNDGPKDTNNDGIPDADAISFALSVLSQGANSGLIDTLSGDAVLLFLQGNDVVGRIGNSAGAEVFRLSVDSNNGLITLNQSRAVVHNDPTDPDEADTPATLAAANLIQLQASIIDGDADHAHASLNIGQTLKFEDDGPSIERNHKEVPYLTVDETYLNVNASSSFAHLFNSSFGNDGPKDVNDNDIPDADAILYTLNVSAQGANSGLMDTLTNDTVLLFLEGGIVIGRAGSNLGAEVFRISVNESTGLVTLDQKRAVVHDDPNDHDEANSPAALASSNLVILTATITDGDLDMASASTHIGNAFFFEDDGPKIYKKDIDLPKLIVDESDFNIDASASFAQAFQSSFGNDGPKDTDDNDIPDADALVYALSVSAQGANSGLIDTLTGDPILLYLQQGQVVGRVGSELGAEVFRISVNQNGTVNLNQSRSVVHDDPNDSDEASSPAILSSANLINLTATIIDGDLDKDSETLHIGQTFKFEDDGPKIHKDLTKLPELRVDESDFTINDSANFKDAFTIDFGNDGPKDVDDNDIADVDAVTYSLGVSVQGVNSGLIDTLSGSPVLLFLQAGEVVGRIGNSAGAEVFRLSVDTQMGDVTFDQSRAVYHNDPTDPDEADTPAMLASANLITLNAKAIDGDLDHASESINIGHTLKFEDDGPTAVDNCVTVEESVKKPYNFIFVLDVSGSMATHINGSNSPTRLEEIQRVLTDSGKLFDQIEQNASDYVITIIPFRTDALNPVEFTDINSAKNYVNNLNAQGTTDYHDAVTKALGAINTDANDPSLNNYIDVVFYMSDGLPNPPQAFPSGQGLNNTDITQWQNALATNNINAIVIGLESVPGGVSALNPLANPGDSYDDVPGNNTGVFLLDDQFTNVDAAFDFDFQVNSVSGDLKDNVDIGADNHFDLISVAFAFSSNQAAQAYLNQHPELNGQAIGNRAVIGIPNDPIITPQGGKLTVNENGIFNYEAPFEVQQGPNGEPVLDGFYYTVRDGDLDPVTAFMEVKILDNDDGPDAKDDGPIAQPNNYIVDEDDLNDGSDTSKESLIIQGNILSNDNLGDDGATITNVSGIAPDQNGVITIEDSNSKLVVYTKTYLNNIPGDFAYTLKDNMNHPSGNGQNDLLDQYVYTIKDTDSAKEDSATLSIKIIDDVPTAINDPLKTVEEGGFTISGNVVSGPNPNSADPGDDILGADKPVLVINFQYTGEDGKLHSANADNTVDTLHGMLTVNTDGGWTYKSDTIVDHGVNGNPVNDNFLYTIQDADGDQSSATQAIQVKEDDGPKAKDDPGPGAIPDAYQVDEDDLVDGTDTTKEPLFIEGNILANDDLGSDGASIINVEGVTANAVTGIIVIEDGQRKIEVYTKDFNSQEAGYFKYTLKDNYNHQAGQGENTNPSFDLVQEFDYTIKDNDSNKTSSATISVRIIDDVPIGGNGCSIVEESTKQPYNFVFVLDVSGSMATHINGSNSPTRLEEIQRVLADSGKLFDQIQSNSSEFMITIIPFRTNALDPVSFTSINSAKNYVNNLTAEGTTDYHDAAQTALGVFNNHASNPNLANYKDVVFFMSDGLPNPPQAYPSGQGLNSADITQWQNALSSNNINSIVIGLESVPGGVTALNPLANPGDSYDDVPGNNTGVFLLDDQFSNVDAAFDFNFQVNTVSGDLKDNVTIGADNNFTMISIAFAFDNATLAQSYKNAHPELNGAQIVGNQVIIPIPNVQIITPEEGKLTVNANGTFTYVAPFDVQQGPNNEPVHDDFIFTFRDNDHDIASGLQEIKITGDADDGPHAVDDGPLAHPNNYIVDEDDLPSGSSPNAQDLKITGNILANDALGQDGATIMNVEGIAPVNGVITIEDAQRKLVVYTQDKPSSSVQAGDFEYTLKSNFSHPNGNGQNNLLDQFDYTIKDNDSTKQSTATISIKVIDDVPMAIQDTNTIQEAESHVVKEIKQITFEGYASGTIIDNEYLASHGVTIKTDNYTTTKDFGVIFNSNANNTPDPDLEYDGQWAGGNLKNTNLGNLLIIQEGGTSPTDTNQDGKIDQIPNDEGDRAAGSFTFNFDNAICSFGFDIVDIESGDEVNKTKLKFYGDNGFIATLTLLQFAALASNFDTLQLFDRKANRIDLVEMKEISSQLDGVHKVVIELGGSSGIDNIKWGQESIDSSIPQINGNVLTNDIAGADNAKKVIAFDYLGEVNSNPVVLQGTIGVEVTTYVGGKFLLNQDGSYTYKAPENGVDQDKIETFNYTMQDGDQDTSSSKLKITVENTDNLAAMTSMMSGEISANNDDLWIADNAGEDSVTGNVLDNDAGSIDTRVVEIIFETDNAAQYIADNQLSTVNAYADPNGRSVHIPIPQDGSAVEFMTPKGGSLAIDQNGDHIYNMLETTQDDMESFLYVVQDKSGSIDYAELNIHIMDQPSTLFNLMGTSGNDTLSSEGKNGTVTMDGNGGIDEYIIDVSEASDVETIYIKDLSLSGLNTLTFTNVTEHDGQAGLSFMDAVQNFTQNGINANVHAELVNGTTVIFENLGIVANQDVQQLEQQIQAVTAEINTLS